MFVLIMGSKQLIISSSEDARRLWINDQSRWKVRGRMADRVQIDADHYTITAPANWREMIGA